MPRCALIAGLLLVWLVLSFAAAYAMARQELRTQQHRCEATQCSEVFVCCWRIDRPDACDIALCGTAASTLLVKWAVAAVAVPLMLLLWATAAVVGIFHLLMMLLMLLAGATVLVLHRTPLLWVLAAMVAYCALGWVRYAGTVLFVSSALVLAAAQHTSLGQQTPAACLQLVVVLASAFMLINRLLV